MILSPHLHMHSRRFTLGRQRYNFYAKQNTFFFSPPPNLSPPILSTICYVRPPLWSESFSSINHSFGPPFHCFPFFFVVFPFFCFFSSPPPPPQPQFFKSKTLQDLQSLFVIVKMTFFFFLSIVCLFCFVFSCTPNGLYSIKIERRHTKTNVLSNTTLCASILSCIRL